MKSLDSILTELRAERDRLNRAIATIEGIDTNGSSTPRVKRQLSAAGRARIVAAQRARWAKVKAKKKH